MTEAIFTAGPWIVRRIGPHKSWSVFAESSPLHNSIAKCGLSKGNADLVAAAPDLYQIVSTLVGSYETYADHELQDIADKRLKDDELTHFDALLILSARAALARVDVSLSDYDV